MAYHNPDDILVPPDPGAADGYAGQSRVAAFVPITLALLGIGVILLGGISARHDQAAATQALDPVMTGSVPAPGSGAKLD